MSSELPSLSGSKVIAAFEKAGFTLDHIRGGHHILKKPGHRFILSVPVHGNRTIKHGTLRGLIRAAGLTVAEFVELLD